MADANHGDNGSGRRGFLRASLFGGAVASLAGLLRAESAAGRTASRKRVVFVHLDGGPPQLDTIDLKPNAPVEIRGDFQPIETSVPGISICELLPKLASAEPVKTAAVQVAQVSRPEPKTEPKAEAKADPKAEPVKVAPPIVATKPVVAISGNASADVASTISAWAKAWAAKDTAGYLGFYAPDFETPGGMKRAAWEAQRRERIEPKKSISVDVKIIKTSVQGNVATVVFRQIYRADALKSDNTKTLRLVKTGDRWLINAERAGG